MRLQVIKRELLLRLFGKNRFFWKIVEVLLKFLKSMRSDKCIFCDIVSGKIQSRKVYEDELTLAFHDINPQAPVHIIVIPKKHISTLLDVKDEDKDIVMSLIQACSRVAKEMNIDEKGFRIVVNTNPQGGQLIYHLHIHLLGGRQLRWPPG